MTSGWSHRATQRSTSASSSSSISSKWRFATPSLERGHSLSEGWSSGEWEGRYSRCIPSGTSRSFFAVCQAALSTISTMLFFFPAPTSLAKFSSAMENACALTPWVGSMDLPAVGAREGIEVGPLVSLMDLDQRSLSYGAPYLAHDRLWPQTPALDTVIRMRCSGSPKARGRGQAHPSVNRLFTELPRMENSPKFGLRIVHRSLSERREYGF